MTQVWRKLLFAHWPLPAEALRPLLPTGLTLDTYNGQAWLGIIPFLMDSVRFRWLPGIPSTTQFAEINVRTYVTADDKPGIFFLSLDANSLLAIIGARVTYALPYYRARFAITTREEAIDYRCERVSKTPAGATSPATFAARYQPTGPAQMARRGSLEDWLTARYCLYTLRSIPPVARRGASRALAAPARRGRHHPQYHDRASGYPPADGAPLLHYSELLEVLVWPLRQMR